MKKLPNFKYILSNTLSLPYEKMPEIYSKCFIGLRFTNHDGNANMVQEMLSMGIPVIHNGDYNTIKWNNKNFYSIIYNINSIFNNLAIEKEKIDISENEIKKGKNIVIIFEKSPETSELHVADEAAPPIEPANCIAVSAQNGS